MKDKLCKTIFIRPAIPECWAVKKKDENQLNSAEMRMLRWAIGKIRLDHIRNEDIRKEAHVKSVETFLENKRLKCSRGERNHIRAKSPSYRCFLEEQRPTEKEMEGQHTGRPEEIPTD